MGYENIRFPLGPLTFQVVALSPQYHIRSSYNRHRHAFMEIHVVTQGSCSFRVGEANQTVKAGELLCIGAGVYHSVKTASSDLSKMSFGLEMEDSQPWGEDIASLKRLQSFQAVQLPSAQYAPLWDALRTARDSAFDEFLFCEELKAQLALFVLHLIRNIPQPCQTSTAYAMAEQRYAQSIEEFFNLNHSLKNGKVILAQRLCLSVRQLNRILHTLYGMSYREKLNEIRLEIARDLLQTTNKSVEEIAEFLGYGNGSNFTAFIKSSTGKTPSQIRKESTLPPEHRK